MGGDAIVFPARSLGDRVRGLVWVDAFRSLGDEPTSAPEDVRAFVAPFREDFGAAVDRFARNLFPEGTDGALVDRIAGSMAAAPQDATLGSVGYARNRHPPILVALAELTSMVQSAGCVLDGDGLAGAEASIRNGPTCAVALQFPALSRARRWSHQSPSASVRLVAVVVPRLR
jgi:hypothetical protein